MAILNIRFSGRDLCNPWLRVRHFRVSSYPLLWKPLQVKIRQPKNCRLFMTSTHNGILLKLTCFDPNSNAFSVSPDVYWSIWGHVLLAISSYIGNSSKCARATVYHGCWPKLFLLIFNWDFLSLMLKKVLLKPCVNTAFGVDICITNTKIPFSAGRSNIRWPSTATKYLESSYWRSNQICHHHTLLSKERHIPLVARSDIQ